MLEKIENPKVFISYAWGTEDYMNRVLSFARDLVEIGIDVEIDRWSLKEGYDSYAFMEQSVNDSTISNVIILLDPVYAKKADERTGGVGTETQIISAEIYNRTKQDRFIPVVFGRDENGDIKKPSYLKGLLHFDLTDEEKYDGEFQRLVKRLYGREAIKKPSLGTKPAWVDQDPIIHTKTMTSFEILKSNYPERIKQDRYIVFLNEIKSLIISFKVESLRADEELQFYDAMRELRDQFLLLIKYYKYVEDSEKSIITFFEETKEKLSNTPDNTSRLKELLLNELFIYTVAYWYKVRDYRALSKLFCKTYFIGTYGHDEGQSFEVFRMNKDSFDDAVRKQSGKRYYSGIASWWIEHLNTDICSKADFVFADILCFNASIIIDSSEYFYWFPVCYVYDSEEHKSTHIFANKLKSADNLEDAANLFGFDDKESFIERIKELETPEMGKKIRQYGFSGRFDGAPYIGQFIKSSELGTKR